MTPVGSPFWQTAILGLAALFLLWEMWRGWRAGVVRSGLHLAAIVLSSTLGFLAAQVIAAPFGGFKEASGFIAGLVAGVGVGFVVFFVIWLLGSILFKRTEHQSGLFRFFWGLGGAFFGLLMGLIILWGAVSLIRGAGVLAQARIQPPAPGPHHYVEAPKSPNELTKGLITLKESLEIGPAGKVIDAVDPVPAETYELLGQIGRVTSDQETMYRFLQYPGIQKVLQSSKIAELLNDPSVISAAQEGNLLGLMSNPALLKAVQDPAFVEELSKVNLQEALKFALENPTASPSTSSPPPAKKK